eukprot:TRINITY_DN27645_c0_g1_i1.p1 TRINITY_DN27645_c0_g1~~TRINITY_DN27645_c0_g1_i1.p1  ORF type:complete len:591 (+),score=118.17 TRINITY_DN27645_c0_g1_i1:74-1846(+)
MWRRALAAVIFVHKVSGVFGATNVPTRAKTESGDVEGIVNGSIKCDMMEEPFVPAEQNVATFLGIPYAEAPVGDARWRPPKPRRKWDGVFSATKAGHVCPQYPGANLFNLPDWVPEDMHEDCLSLNIWAPVATDGTVQVGRKRAVLVFFHGGGFISGSGYAMMGCPVYDSQGLASTGDVVVVTLNYRLGAFGFLAQPDFLTESGTTGNYGVQDQRLALQWLQENIEHFGGDPKRVTLMGESAGARSVVHHMVSSRSSGLFQQGIAESSYDVSWSLEGAYARADAIAGLLGCVGGAGRPSVPACLRSKSTDDIMKAFKDYLYSGSPTDDMAKRMLAFGPVSDGFETPQDKTLPELLRERPPKFPLLLGSNLNETNLFLCTDSGLKSKTTADAVDSWSASIVQYMYPKVQVDARQVGQMRSLYLSYEQPQDWARAFTTDVLFSCAAERAARAVAGAGAKVYRYLFARPTKLAAYMPCLGVAHTEEIFGMFSRGTPKAYTDHIIGDADSMAVANHMIDEWLSFVKTGAPSASWRAWSNEEAALLKFGSSASGAVGAAATEVKGYRQEVCSELAGLMHPSASGNMSGAAYSIIV